MPEIDFISAILYNLRKHYSSEDKRKAGKATSGK
jgi:hypothetical protein